MCQACAASAADAVVPRAAPSIRRRWREVRDLLGDSPRRHDLLIEFLHRIQDHYRCISTAHMTALAAELKLATTEIYEVADLLSPLRRAA